MSAKNPVGHTSRTANPYRGSETVDLSSEDMVFTEPVRGLIVTVSGNVTIHLVGDAVSKNLTIPVLVTSGHHFELRGYVMDKVIFTGTTATVTEGLV